MIQTIIYEDEITLWWDMDEFSSGTTYEFYLDGKLHGATDKTHYTFANLQADTVYNIELKTNAGKIAFAEAIKTKTTKRRLDITKAPYFAVGDGVTLNTVAIQNALNDCGENDCVYVPRGIFLTGALTMFSNTELYLDDGAVLKGSEDPANYTPKIKSRFEGIERMCYRSLINMGELDHTAGCTTKNIIIRGKGTIFGGGAGLKRATIEVERQLMEVNPDENAEYIKACENKDVVPGRARGRLINISNCQNIIISGLTLGYSASWNVHFVYSKNIVTYGCTILSHVWKSEDGVWDMEDVSNGDGWDPDSSEDSVIFDTDFYTRDDCVAIKSGKNPEGNMIKRPTKNISVFDCRGNFSIAVGSEVSGGISDIRVWDCDFFAGTRGFSIKTTRKRGAYIRNVYVRNCRFPYVMLTSAYKSNDDGVGASDLTVLENVSFENVDIKGAYPYLDRREIFFYTLIVCGFDEEESYFNNIKFKGVRIFSREDEELQSIKIKNVKNLSLENIEYVKQD